MAEIIEYRKDLAPYFKQINMDWLEKYFVAEPYDVEVLSNPEKYILEKGGNIYFVAEEGIPKGAVALIGVLLKVVLVVVLGC